MSLQDLWLSAPDQIREKHVQQVIAFAGEGKLIDGGAASLEFRSLLAHLPSQLLGRYAAECLSESFPNSGLALQDVVNEIGRRLGFSVTAGRYRGMAGQIGFDGLWRFPSDHGAVVEVKTTDAYRIDLNTIANYRKALIADGQLSEAESSMLIVVGRQDTGDLEAQIRGSRHAWDIRVISIESLLRLLALKEELEDPETVRRIHAILIPREFTRLDDIVDLIFSTAEEVKHDEAPDEDEDEPEPQHRREPKFIPVAFHEACVQRIQIAMKTPLVRESRASFISPDRRVAVVCAVSKQHERVGGGVGYWFAFHPHQRDALQSAPTSYVAFGCGSAEQLVLIPFSDFQPWLDQMNVTERADRMYWHVKIRKESRSLQLLLVGGRVDLSRYLVASVAPQA